jgi:hypothetical protein
MKNFITTPLSILLVVTIVVAENDNLRCPGMIMSVNPKAPCYKVIMKPENYSSALATCITFGGQLATAKDEFVNSFIQSMFYKN